MSTNQTKTNVSFNNKSFDKRNKQNKKILVNEGLKLLNNFNSQSYQH